MTLAAAPMPKGKGRVSVDFLSVGDIQRLFFEPELIAIFSSELVVPELATLFFFAIACALGFAIACALGRSVPRFESAPSGFGCPGTSEQGARTVGSSCKCA